MARAYVLSIIPKISSPTSRETWRFHYSVSLFLDELLCTTYDTQTKSTDAFRTQLLFVVLGFVYILLPNDGFNKYKAISCVRNRGLHIAHIHGDFVCTARFFYRCPEHRSNHGCSGDLHAIKLPFSVRRLRKDVYSPVDTFCGTRSTASKTRVSLSFFFFYVTPSL